MLDVEPDEPADVGILPVEHILATVEAIEAAFSLTPMLYIGLPYPGKDDPRLFRFPLVFPAFTNEERAMGFAAQMGRPPVIWQWGGGVNGPTIAGISGRVDANRIEDMARFRSALVGGAGPEIPVIVQVFTGAPLEFMPTIAAGAEGNAVVVLQGLLIERMFLDRPANRDGKFEGATDERVRRLQAERSLAVNGVVDTATWAALAVPALVPA